MDHEGAPLCPAAKRLSRGRAIHCYSATGPHTQGFSGVSIAIPRAMFSGCGIIMKCLVPCTSLRGASYEATKQSIAVLSVPLRTFPSLAFNSKMYIPSDALRLIIVSVSKDD